MKLNTTVAAAAMAASVMAGAVHAANYELVWSDEFDGNSLDTSKWSYQLGDGCDINLCGWGNNERQFYKESNVTVANGLLTITAKAERTKGSAYSSGRIRTIGKGDFTFGKIEARMKLPGTQGVWPAFWMLPTDEQYGTWAASGEIDIMEAINLNGSGGNTVHGTLHYGGNWPNNIYSGMPFTPATSVTDEFHVYTVEWEPGVIRWLVDGQLYQTQTDWYTENAPFPAPFDQRFYILLNVAVGGEWPGDPDATTVMPQTMEVDWVRVYQDPAISGNTGGNGGDATATAVDSIVAATRRVKGAEKAEVTVTITDDLGAAVAGATVQGSFSGDFTESVSGVTDGNGVVKLMSSGSATAPVYDFCVDDVTGTTLPYDSALNGATCVTYP